ncbi:hypothetical protein GQ457_08G017530 [Hibiscus cannabinus]
MRRKFASVLVLSLTTVVFSTTDPGDLDVLMQFKDGLDNHELLKWPENGSDPCGPPSWNHVYCENSRVTQIQAEAADLKGSLPRNLNKLSMLNNIGLQRNQLSGKLPSFSGLSNLRYVYLDYNNCDSIPSDFFDGLDDLEVLAWTTTILMLASAENIGNLTLLQDLNLNGNQLVGLIPISLANMRLEKLDLSNNHLMGPIPVFKASKVTFNSNEFCQATSGLLCSIEVMALIRFLEGVNYPPRLVSSWSDNDSCNWLGIRCNGEKVSIINLPHYNLSGSLSPSIAKLDSLSEIRLQSNNLSGHIPSNWTSLKSLETFDLSDNNLSGPLPKFSGTVNLITTGNPLRDGNKASPMIGDNTSPESSVSPSDVPLPPRSSRYSGSTNDDVSIESTKTKGFKRNTLVSIIVYVASFAVLAFLVIPLSIYYYKKRKASEQASTSLVIHPQDPSDPNNMVKVVVAANNTNGSTSTVTGSGFASRNSSSIGDPHIIEVGNLVISVQVLRDVTKNFAPKNEIGRSGFGVVYEGKLDDGTQIVVKRMEAGVITKKALDEFHAEIAVLSKVRHRHLVSLLGCSIEGNDRILVYEYMSQGALSKHLFHRKSLKLEPLSWKRRLNIALDVARGMEYLHTLAHRSFINRDLKSSNILLSDDFRAKVSDFGLVKLAPDGERSVITRLAGTFGYLAPEYASDVFSFGVVLMELLTGLTALDDDRPEETQYLATWFWNIKSDMEKLRAAIDLAIDVNDETLESISIITELVGHCTAREPSQRPYMGHAVNVLAQLVEKWKPLDDDNDDYCGIDYNLPLNQMVKDWQEAEGKDFSYLDLEDIKGSIPARPTSFVESFTSANGR